MSAERKFSRRQVVGAAGASLLLLVACKQTEGGYSTPTKHEPTPSFETAPIVEQKNFPPGVSEIMKVGNQGFLLKHDSVCKVPDIQKYLMRSKSKVRVLETSSIQNMLIGYPLKEAPTYDFVIDNFTGDLKDSKKFGGEINIFAGGILTEDRVPPTGIFIRPYSTFVDIRNRLESESGFGSKDTLAFTYGRDMLDLYGRRDTITAPKKNIENALAFFKRTMEDFPLARFNLIGHSFGGVVLLEIAKRYFAFINNIILLSSPINGIKEGLLPKVAAGIAELIPIVNNQQVSDYLIEGWRNEKFRKELHEFVESLNRYNQKKILIIAAEDDPIVSVESAKVPGTEFILLPSLRSAPNISGHGRTLIEPLAVNSIFQRIGKNLAV